MILKTKYFALILILLISCNKAKSTNQDWANIKDETEVNHLFQLYKPEDINMQEIKSKYGLQENDYLIVLKNSKLLDGKFNNIELDSRNIAKSFKKLLKNNSFKFHKIKVEIYSKKGGMKISEYLEDDL